MRAECFTTVFLCKSYTFPSFLSDFHSCVSFAFASCQPGGDAYGGGDFGIAHGDVEGVAFARFECAVPVGGIQTVSLLADGEAEQGLAGGYGLRKQEGLAAVAATAEGDVGAGGAGGEGDAFQFVGSDGLGNGYGGGLQDFGGDACAGFQAYVQLGGEVGEGEGNGG